MPERNVKTKPNPAVGFDAWDANTARTEQQFLGWGETEEEAVQDLLVKLGDIRGQYSIGSVVFRPPGGKYACVMGSDRRRILKLLHDAPAGTSVVSMGGRQYEAFVFGPTGTITRDEVHWPGAGEEVTGETNG